MNELGNILKEAKFFETNEKDIFINELHGDYYISKVLVYNNAIAYYKIINSSEHFEIEYNGDKSINNLQLIGKIAHDIACLVQNRIVVKRLSLDNIKSLLNQKYLEWTMSCY